MNELIEKAREFVATELFTDGCGDKARRLVFEYEREPVPPNGKTGWSAAPVADRVADFASTAVKEREREIAAELKHVMVGHHPVMKEGDFKCPLCVFIERLEAGKEQG